MKTREALFKDWPGCTNHGCLVTGPKKGMGTNASCQCLSNATRSQLTLLQGKLTMLINRVDELERTTFTNTCTCGGFAWALNGRPQAQPHMDWCPQADEYKAWYAAVHGEPYA